MNSILLGKIEEILSEPSKAARVADMLSLYDVTSEQFQRDYLTALADHGYALEAQAIINALRDKERA